MKYYAVTYTLHAGILAQSAEEAEEIFLTKLEADRIRSQYEIKADLTLNQSEELKRRADNYGDEP